ncbi:MAG: hypothetical protein AAGC55_13150 [Myxococcota bacterium]
MSRVFSARVRVFVLVLSGVALSVSCDERKGADKPAAPAAAPDAGAASEANTATDAVSATGIDTASAAASDADTGGRGDSAAQPDRAILAQELRDRAQDALHQRDGAGCLRDLDRADAVDPPPAGQTRMAFTRGACLLLIGQCDVGTAQLIQYFVENVGKSRSVARAEADKSYLLLCPTSIGPWYERFVRLDFQSGEAFQKDDAAWCKTMLVDLDRAVADAGAAIDKESRGRARRARRLLRQCSKAAAPAP